VTPELFRVLGLAFLAAVGLTLFSSQLPDRTNGSGDVPPIGADATHQREDLVFAVQMELTLRGFDPGSVDGVPGVRTARAIQAFRGWAGLSADDRITGDLLRALEQRP
jgi:peptidoglycan hydrolase-like protein with peptidoglycan-binding domain